MRKILSFLLILVLLLTGCSAQPAETAQHPSAPAQTGAQSSPAPSQESTDASLALRSSAEPIDPGYSDRDREGSYDADDVVARIVLGGSGAAVEGEGAAFADGVITISAEGVYVLTGELDGSIAVDAGENDKVQIVLQDALIRGTDGPAIRVDSADKVFVTVPAGSTAVLSDGAEYALAEGEDEPNACIYSKVDLTLNGAGTLTVQGNYRHAVNSKDDLIVICGALNVTAAEDGLRGKDGVGIDAGEVTISCGGDGIHSSGDADKPEKGWVSLDGGTLTVTAGSDGVQAATGLQLRGGAVNLITGGGADAAPTKTEGFGKSSGRNWFGAMPDVPADGEKPIMPEGGMPPEPPAGGMTPEDGAMPDGEVQQEQDSAESSSSAKGLKSDGGLIVTGGTLRADCADDALHAAGDVRILGGEVTLSTGDDGIHADGAVFIEAGVVNVSRSYEGIEGLTVAISGGNVDVVSSDDGLNAASGTAMGMEAEQGVSITISGGNLHIDTEGDGIDSNGELTVSGGAIVVDGPTNSGNGALDCGSIAVITGGSVVAMGAMQMAVNFGSGSTQCSALVTFDRTVSAGSQLALLAADGTELLTWTAGKAAAGAVISCPALAEGEEYTVTADGQTVAAFTAALPTGGSGMGGFGGGRGGMGGFGGDRAGGKDGMRGQRPTDGAQAPATEETAPASEGSSGQA